MRISDWSSDVCSSDLPDLLHDLGVDAGGRAQQIDRFDDVGAKAELLVLHVSEALFEQIRPHADPRTVAIEILERAICNFVHLAGLGKAFTEHAQLLTVTDT